MSAVHIALAVLAAGCLGIMVAAICRINIMTPKVNRRAWSIMYLAYGGFALGEALAATVHIPSALRPYGLPSEWELMGLLGIGLNLLLTHRHWRGGASPSAAQKECQP